MVEDLRGGDLRFCVALIQDGIEVGGEADPYPVACLAHIIHLQPLSDGQYHIIALGVERVRILSTDRSSKPYLVGSVELWPDEKADAGERLVQRASRLFMEYADSLMKLSGEKLEDFSLPPEPDTLSYVLATALQIETDQRQRLLELPDCAQRLQAEVEILQAELPMLRILASSPRPPDMGNSVFSAN